MHRELMRLQNSHQTDRSNQYTAQDGENFIASESDRQFLLIKYVIVSFSLLHALAQNHTYLVNMCMCILPKNCVFYLLKIRCWIPVLFLCIRWKDIFRFLFIFSKLISTKLQKSPFWLLKINVTSLIVLRVNNYLTWGMCYLNILFQTIRPSFFLEHFFTYHYDKEIVIEN